MIAASVGRKLFRKTPVYDHAGSWLYDASREKVHELIQRRDLVDAIGSATRIKALRFRGPDPALLTGGSNWRRPAGTPHRNENRVNVRGVWHIDRIPETYRPHFIAALAELVAVA